MKEFFDRLCHALFRYRLLPTRYSVKNVRYEVRSPGFLNLWSNFDHLHPAFVRFLEKKKVTYRLKKTMDYSPTICFWSERDYLIYKDAHEMRSFVAPGSFAFELEELGIDYMRRKAGGGGYWYDVFSSTRMIELMLRFDFTSEHGWKEFKPLGTVKNG